MVNLTSQGKYCSIMISSFKLTSGLNNVEPGLYLKKKLAMVYIADKITHISQNPRMSISFLGGTFEYLI